MDNGQPSRTALFAAAARAAHLLVGGEPRILNDTVAIRLLGDQADALFSFHLTHGAHVVLAGMRVIVTARSRYAEDQSAEAVHRGIGQYVILGLDSFAYRSPLIDQVRVFEVDHPATQAWKRHQLAMAEIDEPDEVVYVPVDFRVDSLKERLTLAGFDPSREAFVSWLGVTQNLTQDSIDATLAVIGDFASGMDSLGLIAREYDVTPQRQRAEQPEHTARLSAVSAQAQQERRKVFPPRLA